jgi:Fic family protein
MWEVIDIHKYVRESNLIEGIDNPAEDERSVRAWNWLVQHDWPINADIVLGLHKRITDKQLPNFYAGHFRDYARVNVIVAGRKGLQYQFVPDAMEYWLNGYNRSDNPIGMHIEFEHIHPFADGNGRTGRMLLWWHQVRLAGRPTLFTAENRQDYYKLF